MRPEIITVGDNAYLSDINAAVFTTSSTVDLISEANDPVTFGKYKVAPWGENNDLPQQIMKNIESAEVVEANLFFNICCGYGQGLKPMIKKLDDSGKPYYEELSYSDAKHKKVLDFFEDNDVEGYFLEQLTDMHTFFNVFPEIILNVKGTAIVSLRSKEAAFSRWASIEKRQTRITKHLYSAKWGDNPSEADITETLVIDRFNSKLSLEELRKAHPKELRFVYHINFPTPGRTYYQRPYWWSIFKSGWFDFLVQIPKIKKALLRNQLGLRYAIYVHPDYWKALFREQNVDEKDLKAVKAVKDKELQEINDFVAGEEAAGKGMIVTKNYRPVANGVVEEKWLEIVELPRVNKEGELISDSEEAANIVSYAMHVHPSLIGSTPGKNKGSFSGTDKRELFNIKASMMAPFISRIIKPLYFIKKWNKWPEDLVFINPKIEFTTLDNNKTGQTTKVEE